VQDIITPEEVDIQEEEDLTEDSREVATTMPGWSDLGPSSEGPGGRRIKTEIY